MSDYLIKLTNRDNSIIEQEQEVTGQTNAQTDYRYIGADPNNYVCLKGDGDCTDDELYRIIGVMPTQKDDSGEYENRVKLIKYTSIGEYYYMGSADTDSLNWKESTLNTETLNTEYWSKISDYHNYIEVAKWYIGSINSFDCTTDNYKNERYNNVNNIANIGLLSASDYGFATSGNDSITRNACLTNVGNNVWINDYSYCVDNDWLTTNMSYMTITRTGSGNIAFVMKNVKSDTSGGLNTIRKSSRVNILPSFYLRVNVKYASGNGSKNNPYRIMISE